MYVLERSQPVPYRVKPYPKVGVNRKLLTINHQEVIHSMDSCELDPCQLTTLVTALANTLAQNLTDGQLEVFSAMTVQLGDTLGTISAQRSICCDTTPPTLDL